MSLRDIQRIAFNLVFAPLIGGFMFFAAAAVYEVSAANVAAGSLFANFDPGRTIPPLLAFTYFVGLIPALLNGIITSLVSHRTTSRGWRVFAALLSGAVWSGLFIGALVATGDTDIAPPGIFTGMAVVFGAIASLAVYELFEWFIMWGHHRRQAKAGHAK
ncbi:MAG TPA: hypothetical protein VL418_10325 [Devosiaceae bacterium]|nr:hypothetical protein [Devosiaceae bacterium]